MIDENKLVMEIANWQMSLCPEYSDRDKAIWETLQEVVEAIDEQPQTGAWIPCSERLPDESGDYLTTIQDGKVCYIDKNWFAHTDDYYLEESEWRELCDGEEVIAWMPLPVPYKEGKENGRS